MCYLWDFYFIIAFQIMYLYIFLILNKLLGMIRKTSIAQIFLIFIRQSSSTFSCNLV